MSYVRYRSMVNRGTTTRFSLEGCAEPAEEDSFLWSLADLMTLLLIFFILLYANTLPQPEAALEQPEPILESVIKTPKHQTVASFEPVSDEFTPQDTQSEPLPELAAPSEPETTTADPTMIFDSVGQKKMKTLEESFSSDFYIRWEEKEPVFVLGERITFNIGNAMLLEGACTSLERIVEIIKPLKEYQVIVSGHTDNVAIRTPIFPSNWELSAARAASVAKFLAAQGIDPRRLIIQGKSEFHPLIVNNSEENRMLNRRVEISLLQQKQPRPAPVPPFTF